MQRPLAAERGRWHPRKGNGKTQKISEAGGLHIVVTPNGSRLWRMAYRFGGKQKLLPPRQNIRMSPSARPAWRRR
jgi:hypothetical protein